MKKTKFMEWWRPLLLILAGAINAAGVVMFLSPSGILDGGISGLSLLLNRVTGVSLAIFIIIINVPFFLFGFKRMGTKFIICSLTAIGSYALFSFVFKDVAALDKLMYASLNDDIFLCAVFGGLISGIGSGLTIKVGGAIDGIEVMAVLFSKKLTVTVGQFVMGFNVVLYVIACFILKDFQIGLYSIVTYGIGLKAVDFIVEGFDKGKGCIIITENADVISEAISKRLGRSVTLLNAKGYYSGKDSTMMYCVVNRFEISKLKSIIAEIDPSAFVTISEISEVLGSGVKARRKVISLRDTPIIDNDTVVLTPDTDIADEITESEFDNVKDAAITPAAEPCEKPETTKNDE